MPVNPLMNHGEPVYNPDGVQIFRVRVYDPVLGKQIERRVAGETAASEVEVDLLRTVQAPIELRRPALGVEVPTQRKAVDASKVTVGQYIPIYLEHFRTRRDGTTRPNSSWTTEYNALTTYIERHWRDRPMVGVKVKEMSDFVAALTRLDGKPLSGSGKEKVAGAVKRMWKDAFANDVLTVNLMLGLPSAWGGSTRSARRAVVPKVSEVEELARAMNDEIPCLGDVVRLLAYTGMRWEECNAVCVEDVDWENRTISVNKTATYSGGMREFSPDTKTFAARRLVPVPDELVSSLKRLIRVGDERRRKSGYEGLRWICTAKNGKPLHYSTWRKALNSAQEKTGITYTAHILRHVAASLAIYSGMTDFEVSRMMGHSSVAFTKDVYGHLMSRDQRDVAFKLSEAIRDVRAAETRDARPNIRAVGE